MITDVQYLTKQMTEKLYEIAGNNFTLTKIFSCDMREINFPSHLPHCQREGLFICSEKDWIKFTILIAKPKKSNVKDYHHLISVVIDVLCIIYFYL